MCTNMACHTEHYMEGRQYPLEIHFVHMNTKYSALGDAAGNKDGLLVVGQMFQVGTSESASLTAMGAMMATGGDVSVTPTDMMKNEDGFYAYAGSLTTPGPAQVRHHTAAAGCRDARQQWSLRAGLATRPRAERSWTSPRHRRLPRRGKAAGGWRRWQPRPARRPRYHRRH